MQTPELDGLRAFRHQVYTRFGCRRDALFELLDALLTAPTIETPAHLSLLPSCQRGWASLYEALNAGTMDLRQLEALGAAYPLATETAWYAVDASVWPRCNAETSPERGYYPHPYRHSHGQPIVAGWNYSWLVQVPTRCSSWTAPLPHVATVADLLCTIVDDLEALATMKGGIGQLLFEKRCKVYKALDPRGLYSETPPAAL